MLFSGEKTPLQPLVCPWRCGSTALQTAVGAYRREDVVARALAAAAGFGAHPAMLHVLRMPLALLAAQPTRPSAGLKRRPRHLRIERRLSRENLAGGVADAAQSRSSRIQRANICMSPSPRQASAQAAQVCSQSKQAWMHSTNALGSTAAPLGFVSSIRRA
jgi:hypothetical protein